MPRLISILIITMMLTGCSALRRGGRTVPETSDRSVGSLLTDELGRQNLTNEGFFIPKIEIRASAGGFSQRLIANLKYSASGKYLISFRSTTGIEAARVYIDSDTVLINDRINRKLYHGDPESLALKYGFSGDMLPVLFGDFISDGNSVLKSHECIDGAAEMNSSIKGVRLKYTADCKRLKTIKVTQEGSLKNILAEIDYSAFIKAGDVTTPSAITIRHYKSDIRVEIRIEKIERPWVGNIEFIGGNRYEPVELR